jgi:hypothetical protein
MSLAFCVAPHPFDGHFVAGINDKRKQYEGEPPPGFFSSMPIFFCSVMPINSQDANRPDAEA